MPLLQQRVWRLVIRLWLRLASDGRCRIIGYLWSYVSQLCLIKGCLIVVFEAGRARNSNAIKWVPLCNSDSLDKGLLIQSKPVGMERMLVYAPGYRLKCVGLRYPRNVEISIVHLRRFPPMRQVIPGKKDFVGDDQHTPSLHLLASPSLCNYHMRCTASSDSTAKSPISESFHAERLDLGQQLQPFLPLPTGESASRSAKPFERRNNQASIPHWRLPQLGEW